ncbi:MAG: signal peptidase I, partial [Eggerthellaceae bacterium]|nr:signal peptidase I [Eggerthellaceae bacterium]
MVASSTKKDRILTIIGIVLCVILIPILVVNVILIIKSYTDTESVPSIGGVTPLVILTDSMTPIINSGDLVFCRDIEPEQVRVNDIIAFFDPESTHNAVVVHRVKEIIYQDGQLFFKTKGDANIIADRLDVPAENLVGIYESRIGWLGNVVIFMQTTWGIILCIGVPLLLLIGFDVLRNRKLSKESQSETERLKAELEALKSGSKDEDQDQTQEEAPAQEEAAGQEEVVSQDIASDDMEGGFDGDGDAGDGDG